MYKNYKYYRSWVYTNKVYNELKEQFPEEEQLNYQIQLKISSDSKFMSDKQFQSPPPSQETDYFRQEFYAETYAFNAGIKLIGSVCENHEDCGSRCCPLVTSQSERTCQLNEELTSGQYQFQECTDFENEMI
mmetsp:Transcript_8612/g.14560  ORF Transcript_8612/g.14560 Transcript_8612/m.14560 type:complete len:132 (+) Transcript_8612:233-628(+)